MANDDGYTDDRKIPFISNYEFSKIQSELGSIYRKIPTNKQPINNYISEINLFNDIEKIASEKIPLIPDYKPYRAESEIYPRMVDSLIPYSFNEPVIKENNTGLVSAVLVPKGTNPESIARNRRRVLGAMSRVLHKYAPHEMWGPDTVEVKVQGTGKHDQSPYSHDSISRKLMCATLDKRLRELGISDDMSEDLTKGKRYPDVE